MGLVGLIALSTLYLGYFVGNYWITHITWMLLSTAVASIYFWKAVRRLWRIENEPTNFGIPKWWIMSIVFSGLAIILFTQYV